MGFYQNIVVVIKEVRILDRGSGGVEIEVTRFLTVSYHCAFLAEDREHLVGIEDIALGGFILIRKLEINGIIDLCTIHSADSTFIISGGVQGGIYGDGLTDVKGLCILYTVQTDNSYCQLSGRCRLSRCLAGVGSVGASVGFGASVGASVG